MNVCETKKSNFATSLMMLICASALWGSTFIFTKVLIDYISVSYILFFRSALTAILLYFMFIKTINSEFTVAVMSLVMWSFSVIGFLALYIQTLSLKYTTASNSAFITAFFVVVVPVIERFYYKKIIKFKFYVAVGIAVIGLYCISFGFSLPEQFNYGDSLALVSAVLYGFYIVFLEKLVSRFSEGTIMFFSFALWVFFALITGLFDGGLNVCPEFNYISISNLFAVAILGSVIPYLLMAKGQRVIPAQLASLVYNLEPIFATLLAFLFIGEVFTLSKVIGSTIIFGALVLGSTSR
jgi:drug/metabolite transporter (DMT)-like permease